MSGVHNVVSVVNGTVIKDVIERGAVLVAPYHLDKGMLEVLQFFPKDKTANVLPDRGSGTPMKISTNKAVMVYRPSSQMSPEFVHLAGAGKEFENVFNDLYMDVIKENEPKAYEAIMGVTPSIKEEEEESKIDTKVCDTCGVEFISKAWNAKYCEEHRNITARKAYVAPKVEAPKSASPKVVDLTGVPPSEPAEPEVAEESTDTTPEEGALKVDMFGRVIAEVGDTLTYYTPKGVAVPMEVLEVTNSVFKLRNPSTNGVGEISRAVANWTKRGDSTPATNDKPVDVAASIKFVKCAGVPEEYVKYNITVDSVVLIKDGKEGRYMVNKDRNGNGLYVRRYPFGNGPILTEKEASLALRFWDTPTA